MRWLYRIVFWGGVFLAYLSVLKDQAPVAFGAGLLLYYANRISMREILGRKKYFLYALTFCVLWSIGFAVNSSLIEEREIQRLTDDNDVNSIIALAIAVFIPWLILAISFQATITKDWFDGFSIKDRFKFKIKRLRYEKTKVEMDLLKTQLSPHLYKNLLTNIYDLVLNNKEEAPDAIVSLTKLMEYLLYDTAGKEKVEIKKEIDFIEKLIEIRKIGLKEKAMISLAKLIHTEAENKHIIPFALLPFVENIFTHCNFSIPGAYTKIEISIDREGKLKYYVENTIGEETKSNKGGLGIKNLRARLEEYYKNRFEMNLHGGKGIFTSKLEMKL